MAMLMMPSRWLFSKLKNDISLIGATNESHSNPEAVFGGMNVSEDILKELLTIIKHKMTPQPVKIRARKYIMCVCVYMRYKHVLFYRIGY